MTVSAPAQTCTLQTIQFEVVGKSESARITCRLVRGDQILGEVAVSIERTVFEPQQAAVRRALSEFASSLVEGVSQWPVDRED